MRVSSIVTLLTLAPWIAGCGASSPAARATWETTLGETTLEKTTLGETTLGGSPASDARLWSGKAPTRRRPPVRAE